MLGPRPLSPAHTPATTQGPSRASRLGPNHQQARAACSEISLPFKARPRLINQPPNPQDRHRAATHTPASGPGHRSPGRAEGGHQPQMPAAPQSSWAPPAASSSRHLLTSPSRVPPGPRSGLLEHSEENWPSDQPTQAPPSRCPSLADPWGVSADWWQPGEGWLLQLAIRCPHHTHQELVGPHWEGILEVNMWSPQRGVVSGAGHQLGWGSTSNGMRQPLYSMSFPLQWGGCSPAECGLHLQGVGTVAPPDTPYPNSAAVPIILWTRKPRPRSLGWSATDPEPPPRAGV